MKQRLDEIGIMRAILILAIVIGHAFAIYGVNPGWKRPEGIQDIPEYAWVNPVFISFTLQAFVFVSGYVLALYWGGYRKGFIFKKFKRLILPTLIFGLAYWAIIEDFRNIDSPFDVVVHLINGPGHLWFLPMLFDCFVIFVGFMWLKEKIALPIALWVIGIVLLSVGSPIMPSLMRINSGCSYFIFFIAGYIAFGYRDRLMRSGRGFFISTIALTCLLILIKLHLRHMDATMIITIATMINNILLGLSGSFMTLLLCFRLQHFSSLVIIGSWSGFFGVYLIHQFILRFLYHKTLLFAQFDSGAPFVALLITLVFSYLIAEVLLRFPLTRKLI